MSNVDARAIPRQHHDIRRRDKAVAIGLGLACHVLFVLGVGTMMVAMYFGMSRSFGRLGSASRRSTAS